MGRCVRYTGVFLRQRTHLRTHSLQVVHIFVYLHLCICMHMCMDAYVCLFTFVYMHAYVYGCVCASMILLDTLRRCY